MSSVKSPSKTQLWTLDTKQSKTNPHFQPFVSNHRFDKLTMDQLTARKLLQKRPMGSNSPRTTRKPMLSSIALKGFHSTSSQNLNISKSPLANRKAGNNSNHSNNRTNNSAQNSPNFGRSANRRPRPRSLSDDRINNEDFEEAVALLSHKVSASNSKEPNDNETNNCYIDMDEQTSAIV